MVDNIDKRPKIFYGWWIVASCAMITFCVGGTFYYGFTAFFDPIREHLGSGYAAVSFAASLRGIEMGVAAPVMGLLADRIGPRKLIFSGILLMGFGFMLLSRANSLGFFYFAFIVTTVGFSGCTMVVMMTTMANWFYRKMGRASGLLLAGGGLGGLLVPVVTWLIDMYTWQTALTILGIGLWVVGLPLSLVVRHRPESYGYLPDGESAIVSIGGSGAKPAETGLDYGPRQALRTRSFWILCLLMGVLGVTMSSVFVHVMPYLNTIGVSKATAAWFAMSVPLFSVLGRIGFGWAGDVLNERRSLALAFALQGIGVVLFAYAGSAWMLVGFALCFGPGYGGVLALRQVIQREYFGRKAYGTIQGIMLPVSVIGGVVGPTLAGWIYDVSGSYHLAWIIFAVLAALAVPLALALKHPGGTVKTVVSQASG